MMLLRVFMVLSIIATAMASRLPRSNEGSIEGHQKCIALNGEEGLCVNESLCTEEHTIIPGGVLDDTEYRSSLKIQKRRRRALKTCPGLLDWCCTIERVSRTLLTPNK